MGTVAASRVLSWPVSEVWGLRRHLCLQHWLPRAFPIQGGSVEMLAGPLATVLWYLVTQEHPVPG